MRALRRWSGAALLVAMAAASARGVAEDSAHRHEGHAGATEHRQILEAGEARLAAGDALGAQRAFDQATQLAHDADTELSLVRAYMQAGEYRRALAFAAHAAGAHAEIPAGMALYAWLLHIGGQTRVAGATLEGALARAPSDPVLQQARASLSGPWPAVSGVLAEGPWRVAPHAWGTTVPAHAQVRASGVLIDGGRAVLVPGGVLGQARRVWVRNGLGQTSAAGVEKRFDTPDLTLLRLASPLAPPPAMRPTAREPFGGSPAYTAEYSAGAGDRAAWPLLRQGFMGGVPRDDGPRPLGIEVPPGPRGGPVFDAAGRLVGIAITDGAGVNRIVFASRVGALIGAPDADAPAVAPAQRMPLDEIYERALTATVQVILAP